VIKGEKMTTLNEYITRIENQDTTLTDIELMDAGLNNADAERLMQALGNAPEIAKNIQTIAIECNQLTSIDIPATFTALEHLLLSGNQLTSINIPASLIALKELHLYNNQLTTINIPDTLIALDRMSLSRNQLTSINIPDTLIALQLLYLHHNQLTNINIPATLIELVELTLNNNQLTSINIPDTLIALQELNLQGNQLTAATKIALTAFGITRPALLILIEENIPEQLTPAILQEHFQTMALTYLSIMNSKTFKDSVLGLHHLYKERAIPAAIISSHISETLPQKLLLENIAMLRRCFANNQVDAGTLNSWLESPEMKSTIRMFNQELHNEITKLFDMYDRKFSDIRRMRDTRALVVSSVAALTRRHKPD
jgi:hypothetical protein